MFDGTGDNEGTVQERTERCARACYDKITPIDYGPWSSRGDALGFGLTENNGRCYCQNDEFASCNKDHTAYVQYTFDTRKAQAGFCFCLRPMLVSACPLAKVTYHAVRLSNSCPPFK